VKAESTVFLKQRVEQFHDGFAAERSLRQLLQVICSEVLSRSTC